MTVAARRLEQRLPDTNSRGRSVAVTRLPDQMVGSVRVMVYFLLGAVSVVLLITCANIATLLLGNYYSSLGRGSLLSFSLLRA